MLVGETCLEIVTNLLHGSSRIKTPVTEFPKCEQQRNQRVAYLPTSPQHCLFNNNAMCMFRNKVHISAKNGPIATKRKANISIEL